MKERLPVHCCCNPEKRLGTVPVHRLPMGVAMFQVMPEPCPDRDRPYEKPERVIVTKVAKIRVDDGDLCAIMGDRIVDMFVKPIREHEAVKSNHEPIEVWRRVPGFEEEP